jgi:hypothetical protein
LWWLLRYESREDLRDASECVKRDDANADVDDDDEKQKA